MLGDWITLLCEKAGISQFECSEPYFLNVPEASPYYAPVQAAVEWHVLDQNTAFDPYEYLTREWTAYTLMNLAERDIDRQSANTIRDQARSRFPAHISAAVASGLMSLDSHDRFRPDLTVSKEDAYGYLNQVLALINHRTQEETAPSFEWNGDLEFTEEEPEEIDESSQTAIFPKDADVKPEQYVLKGTPERPEAIYQIKEVTKQEGCTAASLAEADPAQVFSEFETAETFEVDFTQAQIIDDIDGAIIQPMDDSSYTETVNSSLMSFPISRGYDYYKTHTVNGYTMYFSISGSA